MNKKEKGEKRALYRALYNIMKRYEVTYTIQGCTENECYKELWCAVILQAVLDLESENEKYRESALYFLKSFDFGRMILKKKGVNIDGK